MKLFANIRPVRYTNPTHAGILEIVQRNTVAFGISKNYEAHITHYCVVVYALNKHNRRNPEHAYKKGLASKTKERLGIKDKYWEAYVYEIPIKVLELLGLKVIQHPRNFEIRSV